MTRALDKCGDEELARRAAAGSDAAVSALYDRHAQGVLRYCETVMRGADEAADAAQEVWVKALRAMRATGHSGSEAFRPWLYTVARHECMDRFRRRSRESLTDVSESQLTPAPAADRVYEARAEVAAAMRDIACLPEPSRTAIALRELAGFDQREVASELGLPAERAGRLLADARRTLTDRRAGRAMDCEEVRSAVTDLRVRSVRVRGHIESCRPCRAFERQMRGRRLSSLGAAPVMALRGLVQWLAPLTGTAQVEGAVAALGSSAVAVVVVLSLALPAPGHPATAHRGDRSVAPVAPVAPAVFASLAPLTPSPSELVADAGAGVWPGAGRRAGQGTLAQGRRDTRTRRSDRPPRVPDGVKPALADGAAPAPGDGGATYPTSMPPSALQPSSSQPPSAIDSIERSTTDIVAGAGKAVSETVGSVIAPAQPVTEAVQDTVRAVRTVAPSLPLAADAP